ncbi:hypothetical protein Nepgr_015008 [Nepenthes gracilis]|uniref:RING-type E3 ubiquitin transferase n=1 Tax=Nepenthes gracilis TaxID=150966 RepID=A0AAD3XQ20_NEPGR|nr:hypothetical protein Nepgr_015008 [Nepenthes gracilis]
MLQTTCNPKHGSCRFCIVLLLLLSQYTQSARADGGGSPSESDSDQDYDDGFSPSITMIIIVLIAAVFLVGFFSIYIRHCAEDHPVGSRYPLTGTAARSRGVHRGLDASVIESFPKFAYSDVKSLRISNGELECAVCLNEFGGDETLRLIPKCDHVFHADCIDTWLADHATCPVCRANLHPQSGESTHSPELDQIDGQIHPQDDVVVEVSQECQPNDERDGGDAIEGPQQAPQLADVSMRLNRNRTRRSTSGRPRWLGRFSRSNSTGHVAVKQWENMERFTLRLPEDVRKQILNGKLSRSGSSVALPREGSSRRGYRAGEGSSRGRFTGPRLDRAGRSDRWAFLFPPPFFSRAPSVRSPKVAATGGGGSLPSPMTVTFDAVNTPKDDDAAPINATIESAPSPV